METVNPVVDIIMWIMTTIARKFNMHVRRVKFGIFEATRIVRRNALTAYSKKLGYNIYLWCKLKINIIIIMHVPLKK